MCLWPMVISCSNIIFSSCLNLKNEGLIIGSQSENHF